LISAGLDVGSRTIKLVTFDTVVRSSLVTETGANPLRRCRELMSGINYERLVVTGYGRHLVAPALGGEIVSEIRAFAVGARYLYPDCRTIIDIGGQDCKVILLTDDGKCKNSR
jgi:activator of 2-hydroxyglutaryl-CoA dehydratase